MLARELGIEVIQPEDLHAPDVLERIAAAEPEVADDLRLRRADQGAAAQRLRDDQRPPVAAAALARRGADRAGDHGRRRGDRRRDHARHRRAGTPAPVYALATEPIHADDDYGTLARAARDARRRAARAGARRASGAAASRTSRSVTYAHKIGPRERALDPTQTPAQVERTIRALRPHIGSRLPLPDGTFLGVIAAQVDGPTLAPAGGRVRTDGDRLLLDCNGGALELTEIRPPGGRPMAAADWLRGRPDPRPDRLPLRSRAARAATSTSWSTKAREEWVDDDDEWEPHVVRARRPRQPRGARRDGRLGADPRPAARELAAYVLGQLG